MKALSTLPILTFSFLLAMGAAPASFAGEVVTLCNGAPNGEIDGAEECETGPCCTETCSLKLSDTVCRESANATCDPEETCGEQKFAVVAECPADVHADAGTPCDDGLFCTVDDECTAGACSGSPRACDDENPCTTDACNEIDDKCDALDNTLACEDGVFCNGDDTCEGGSCSVHSGDPCPGADGDDDCAESCDEEAGACTGVDADESTCDDGNSCTKGDACAGGTCVAGAAEPECTTTTTMVEPPTTTTMVEPTTTTLVETTTTTLVEMTTTTLAKEQMCGDITDDGSLTVRDAYLILRAGVGLPSKCTLHVCDYTGDLEVTSSDALAVLRAAVGLTTDPMCPPEDAETFSIPGLLRAGRC